jgi:hypothetical protein
MWLRVDRHLRWPRVDRCVIGDGAIRVIDDLLPGAQGFLRS